MNLFAKMRLFIYLYFKRNRLKLFLTLPLSLIFLQNCVTHQFQSPYADKVIQLAGWEKKCSKEREIAQWYLFWGAYPINKIDEKEFFPKSDIAYKILFRTNWTDGLISALGSISISVTKKTWVISECPIDEARPPQNQN
jgi:hypothetical protein